MTELTYRLIWTAAQLAEYQAEAEQEAAAYRGGPNSGTKSSNEISAARYDRKAELYRLARLGIASEALVAALKHAMDGLRNVHPYIRQTDCFNAGVVDPAKCRCSLCRGRAALAAAGMNQ